MSFLSNVLGAAVGVAILPVSVAHDVVTSLDDEEEPMTGDNLECIGSSLDDSLKDLANGDIFTDD